MFEGTTGADHQRRQDSRSDRLSRFGERLFRDADARARERGWEVTSRRGGLGRSYRDPRFDALAAARRGAVDLPSGVDSEVDPVVPVGRPVESWLLPMSTLDGRATVSPLERAMVPLARPNPVVVLWRWRYELGSAVTAAVLVWLGLRHVGPLWTVLGGVGAAAAVAAVPATRRFAARRAWCVVTAHRVRTGCAHAWIQSRTGKIPAVLWTSAVPVGERVALWCRPGTTPEDLEAARELLATACWAQDVEVQRHPRRSQLAAVVVVRHPEGRPGRRRPKRRQV